MTEYVENMKEYVKNEGIWRKYDAIWRNMKEHVENMKEYVKNMKEYEEICQYIGFPRIYMDLGTWKNFDLHPYIYIGKSIRR